MLHPTDVKWVNFNQATAGPHVIAPAVAGQRVLICGVLLVGSSAVDVTLEDSSGANLVGPCPAGANGGFVVPRDPDGFGYTEAGKGLSVLLGGSVQVGGIIGYRYSD